MFQYSFFENKFVKVKNAKVSIMTNALQYGTAIFAGIRGYISYDKKYINIFRIEDHYKRFMQAHRILGVSAQYNQNKLISITKQLVRKNKPKTDVYFRPFSYAASTSLSPNLYQNKLFTFALYMIPLGDYLPTNKGLSVKVSSWQRIPDNVIPARAKIAGGYINSSLARQEAEENGYDEAIFLTSDGHVAEGSAENIFIVRNNTLITPPVSDEVLEGITRRSIITLAKEAKIPVQERSIDRSELYVADEAFFSGTGVQIAWIREIDKRTLGTGKIGPISKKLQTMFFKTVRGENTLHTDWLTKIRI